MTAPKSAPARRRSRAPKPNERALVYVPHELDEFMHGLPEMVALDLETTGVDGWGNGDRIIEIAAVRYDHEGREVASLERLIKIGFPIPPVVVELTHITDKMLAKEGVELSGVLDELDEFLRGQPIILGHNINFDLVFLHDAYEALGKRVPPFHAFCTLEASRRLFPDSPDHKLGTIVGQMGVELVDAHRAGPDARADYDAARLLVERFKAYPVGKNIVYRSAVPDRLRDTLRKELALFVSERAQRDGVTDWQVLTKMAQERLLIAPPESREAVNDLVGIAPAQAARYGDELWQLIERARAAA